VTSGLPRPNNGLRDDHILAIERERRPAMQSVAEFQSLTDTPAKASVIGARQHAVDR